MRIKHIIVLLSVVASIAIISGCIGQTTQQIQTDADTSAAVTAENHTPENVSAAVPAENRTNGNVSTGDLSAAYFDYTSYKPWLNCNYTHPVPIVQGEENVLLCDQIPHQLLYPFPLVTSPMPYYIFNSTPVIASLLNMTISNIRLSFEEWENATDNKVRFYEVSEPINESCGIIIEIVGVRMQTGEIAAKVDNWYGFWSDDMSVISGAKMVIDPMQSLVNHTNHDTLMHEIGHIFGLAHNRKNSSSIMWHYASQADTSMTQDIIDTLDVLYHDIPVDARSTPVC